MMEEPAALLARLRTVGLLDSLRNRRSRRFCAGMNNPAGPLQFQSRFAPCPLSESEEAALAFAATGITGPVLGDLCYAPGQGGSIMAGLVGRTIASGDGIQAVSLAVINDRETLWLRRPQELGATEVAELIELSRANSLVEIYRRCRVQIKPTRAAPPLDPLFNINANKWSLYAPGTTYFLPINDLTLMYINGLLEILNESTGAFIVDERAQFRPAGLSQFGQSKGGHLADDPKLGRVATVKLVELLVAEFVAIEQGMMLQNLGLMAHALGLGGFANFANHEFGWFQALGFRLGEMPASKYLGMGFLPRCALKLLGRDIGVPYPLGLESQGQPLLRAFCPPYFPTMADAVHAVVDLKFGANGVLRNPAGPCAWRDPLSTKGKIPGLSAAAINATIAYCEYLWGRYGRFPVHVAPFRTVVGFQAGHLDAEFYDRFYHADALGDNERRDFQAWSNAASPAVKTPPNIRT